MVRSRAIIVAGWLTAIAYSFPGYMSTDSVSQLAQSRGLEPLTDGNPPAMAFLWHILETIVAGPFGMLVLQTGAFLFGLDALLRHVTTPRRAAVIAVAVLLFPPVLAPMGVIWKDSQMCGFALAGAALLLSPQRWRRFFGCGVLIAATAVRYNAAAAMLPLVLGLFDPSQRTWGRHLAAIATWLAIVVLAFAMNSALPATPEYEWYSSTALHDLVGTIKYAQTISDATLEADLTGTPLVVHVDIQKHSRWQYTTTNHWNLWHGERRIFDAPGSAAERTAIAAAWWRMVHEHPGAYLRHRWAVFRSVLNGQFMAVWGGFVENEYQRALTNSATVHSHLQLRWLAAMTALAPTFLFHPGFYFVLALALLPLCRTRVAFALLVSGLCYELALFTFAPSNDFRYSHWMVTCTIIATIMTFVSRSRSGTIPRLL